MFKNFNFDPASKKLFTAPLHLKKDVMKVTLRGTAGTDIVSSEYGHSILLNFDTSSAKLLNELNPFTALNLDGWTKTEMLRFFEPTKTYSAFLKLKLYGGKISAKTNRQLEDLEEENIKGKNITVKTGVSAYFDPEKKKYGLYLTIEEFVFP